MVGVCLPMSGRPFLDSEGCPVCSEFVNRCYCGKSSIICKFRRKQANVGSSPHRPDKAVQNSPTHSHLQDKHKLSPAHSILVRFRPFVLPRDRHFRAFDGLCSKGLGWTTLREYDERAGRKREKWYQANGRNQTNLASGDWMANPYTVLGISPDSSQEDIKAAFRTRVKEYHPDVYKGSENADAITQRLIRAYELLTEGVEHGMYKRSMDPFEDPECEAKDVFVNEINCIGKGCPYSCVARAPNVFQFAANTGFARAVSQGQEEDYGVQLAVGQCPRNCIHWVTPQQRILLEDLMQRTLEDNAYSSEALTLESLIACATYENGRYAPPKRKPTRRDQWVDWF